MKLIEHGNQYNPTIKKCDNCGCKFEYNKSDITDIGAFESEKHHPYWYKRDERVKCPECGNLVNVINNELANMAENYRINRMLKDLK